MMFLFMLLPLLALVYVCWHVYMLLPLAWPWKVLVVGLGVVSFLLLFVNLSGLLDRLPLGLATVFYEVGDSSIIVMLYLTMVFLLLDLLRLLHILPLTLLTANAPMAIGLTVAMVAIFVYGNLHYRNKQRVSLELTTEKPLQHQYKVLMASDMHLGYHNRRAELARWIDLMKAEQPDLILIAGDIVDMSIRPLIEEDMAAEFRRLECPVYACLGNHEYYTGTPQAQQFYRDAHIRLLSDSHAVVDSSLVIIGRDDRTNRRRKRVADLVGKAGTECYTILLDHQPYALEQSEQAGVDFQLSGHTHRGQVWPVSWITDAIYECSWGSHHRGSTQYYVSSGLGIWGGKFRIGTQSEYVVATIREK